MDIDMFNKITTEEANRLVEEIWDRIKPDETNKLALEAYKDYSNSIYKVTICYFLWLMKKDDSIKIWKDLDRVYHSDNFCAAMMTANDLCEEYYFDNEEEWKKLLKCKEIYSIEELAACVLKTEHFEKEFYDEAPVSIEKLVNAFLNISSKDKIGVVNAGKCGYLLDSQKEYPNTVFMGVSEDYTSLFSGFMHAQIYGYDTMTFVSSGSEDDKSTKAFVNTCIEKRRIDYSGYKPRDAKLFLSEYWEEYPYSDDTEWTLCAAGFAMTGLKGKSIAVMNAGELNLKQSEIQRKFLCEKGYIEGVIALPDKMYSNTWVNTYLVIMSNGNNQVKFLDARDMFDTSRMGGKRVNVFNEDIVKKILEAYNDTSKSISISIEKIAESGYNLSPLRYVLNNDTSEAMVELGTYISEIKRGITLKASEMDRLISKQKSNIKCIRASQFSPGVVEEYSYYQGDIKSYKNSTSDGNILISKVGMPFKIAVADADYLVVGNVYILCLKHDISPEYVKCYLSSKKGQEEIAKLAVGSSTPILNISDVEKIRIPVYKPKKQAQLEARAKEIVNELEDSYHHIQELSDELTVMFD